MIVERLKPRGAHSLQFGIPPVLARAHNLQVGDLFEVTVTPHEVRYRKLSPLEIETWKRVNGATGQNSLTRGRARRTGHQEVSD
ncbi:MAG TPA: hypothetical protein VM889_13370 [Candidatus Thermoplasmatota archaeon]|nr:hypothetical protein [Candidatus Thermoplasmatota archaeon]HWH07824.1 hypothetical protein [Candidatus Thermoplasmatota archaeon]